MTIIPLLWNTREEEVKFSGSPSYIAIFGLCCGACVGVCGLPFLWVQLNALEIEIACVLAINSQVAQLVIPAKHIQGSNLTIKYITLITVIKQTTKAYFSIYKLLDSLD